MVHTDNDPHTHVVRERERERDFMQLIDNTNRILFGGVWPCGWALLCLVVCSLISYIRTFDSDSFTTNERRSISRISSLY